MKEFDLCTVIQKKSDYYYIFSNEELSSIELTKLIEECCGFLHTAEDKAKADGLKNTMTIKTIMQTVGDNRGASAIANIIEDNREAIKGLIMIDLIFVLICNLQ